MGNSVKIVLSSDKQTSIGVIDLTMEKDGVEGLGVRIGQVVKGKDNSFGVVISAELLASVGYGRLSKQEEESK